MAAAPGAVEVCPATGRAASVTKHLLHHELLNKNPQRAEPETSMTSLLEVHCLLSATLSACGAPVITTVPPVTGAGDLTKNGISCVHSVPDSIPCPFW